MSQKRKENAEKGNIFQMTACGSKFSIFFDRLELLSHHTKPGFYFWILCSDSVLIYYRDRKEMDSSAGQHRLGWGCRCKDDRVQPSLGLRVSAKYIHSAHAFLGHLIFLMGMIKVSRCFGLEILILNHTRKSEIRPLEPILG